MLYSDEIISQINFKIDNHEILAYEFDTAEEIWIEEADDYCSLFRLQVEKGNNEIFVFVTWYEDYHIYEDVTHLFDTNSLLRYFKEKEKKQPITNATQSYEEFMRKERGA